MNNKCESGSCDLYSNTKKDEVMDNTITLSPIEGTKLLKLYIKTSSNAICIEEGNQKTIYKTNVNGVIDINYIYNSTKRKVPVVTITPYNEITKKQEGSFISFCAPNNKLTFISFTPSSDIEKIVLSDNALSSVFLPTIANVKTLDISNNPILNLETTANMCDSTKKGLHQLSTLNVTGTLLHTLILSHCEKLTNVSYDIVNRITNIKVDVVTHPNYNG